ncbi:hypothetical protein PQX77_003416 [Marasmius sp. AFHP31]|nr:hypothetical protein PQX77_003416 [Marasmius sp. AFHP31]
MPRHNLVVRDSSARTLGLPAGVSSARQRRTKSLYIPLPTAQRVARNIARAERKQSRLSDIQDLDHYIQGRCEELGKKHGKKSRYFEDAIYQNGLRLLKTPRKPNPRNAWKWSKARELRAAGFEKPTIHDIDQHFGDEYHTLTDEDKASLVVEYQKDRAHRIVRPPSARSTAQRVAWAYATVTNLLDHIRKYAGVDSMMLMFRNRTDNVMPPTWWFSNNMIEAYLPTAARGTFEPGRFAAKLEAYAISGYDTSRMYQKTADITRELKAEIRDLVKTALRKVTGDEDAAMHYEEFDRLITLSKGIVLKNWPLEVFCNPSKLSNRVVDLRKLQNSWRDGKTYFEKLSPDDWAAWKADYNQKVADGSIPPKQRKERCDAGSKKTPAPTPRDESPAVNDHPPSVPCENGSKKGKKKAAGVDVAVVEAKKAKKKAKDKEVKKAKADAAKKKDKEVKKAKLVKKVQAAERKKLAKGKVKLPEEDKTSSASSSVGGGLDDEGPASSDGPEADAIQPELTAHDMFGSAFQPPPPPQVVPRDFLPFDFLPNNLIELFGHPLLNPIVYDHAAAYIAGDDPNLNTMPQFIHALQARVGPSCSEEALAPLTNLLWACDEDGVMNVANGMAWLERLKAQCFAAGYVPIDDGISPPHLELPTELVTAIATAAVSTRPITPLEVLQQRQDNASLRTAAATLETQRNGLDGLQSTNIITGTRQRVKRVRQD